jgi:cytochrome c553/DNA-binding beta-propeller fold protein YncE
VSAFPKAARGPDRNLIVIFLFATLAVMWGSAQAKGDPAAGLSKAVICAACHGATGVAPTDAWPSLVGQGQAYLVKQLKVFRDGTRKDRLMEPVAKALSDEDIENLAAYFSTAKPNSVVAAAAQPPTPPPPHVPLSPSSIVKVRAHPSRQYWADKLPEDATRQVIVQKCQMCHDLQRVVAFTRTKDHWQQVIGGMVRRGSPLTPQEIPAVVDYFTKYFGPDSPPIPQPAGVKEVGMKPCKPSEWPKGSSDFRSNWKGAYNVWLSNQQGGNIDIVDPVTRTIVRRIECVSAPDRIEFSRDGNFAYAPDRIEHNITVIDTRTGAIKAKVPLIDRPNTAVLSRDFTKLYVGIWPVRSDEDKRGYVQVVDTDSLKVVKTIETQGGIHDPWMSPDGKMLLAMSPPGLFMNAYDTLTDKLLYTCCTEAEIGTMNLEAGSDGSTRRIFISYAGFYGLVVIDPRTGKEVQRVSHALNANTAPASGSESYLAQRGSGFHGAEISADGKNYWVISGSVVFRYELPSLKPLGNVRLALIDQAGNSFTPAVEGTWLTISPDGQKVWAARPGRNLVSEIDARTMKEDALIPTGEYPLHISIWLRGTP